MLKYYADELQDSKFQYDPQVSVKTSNEMSQGSLVSTVTFTRAGRLGNRGPPVPQSIRQAVREVQLTTHIRRGR